MDLKLKTKPGVFSESGVDPGTKLLLDQNLELQDRSVVADLGCGSGILGMSLAVKFPRAHIHLLDSNLRATELASENVEKNNLRNVEVFLSDLFSSQKNRNYDQIFSNPPAQLGNQFLDELASESFKHLKIGGTLNLVVVSYLKNVITKLLEKYFKEYKILAHGKNHLVFQAIKKG